MPDCNNPTIRRALYIAKASVERDARNKALAKTSRNDALELAARFGRVLRQLETPEPVN